MGKRVTFEFGSSPPCHPDGGWREIKPDCKGCYVPPRAHGVDQIPARRYTESTQTLAQTLCTGLSPAQGFAPGLVDFTSPSSEVGNLRPWSCLGF